MPLPLLCMRPMMKGGKLTKAKNEQARRQCVGDSERGWREGPGDAEHDGGGTWKPPLQNGDTPSEESPRQATIHLVRGLAFHWFPFFHGSFLVEFGVRGSGFFGWLVWLVCHPKSPWNLENAYMHLQLTSSLVSPSGGPKSRRAPGRRPLEAAPLRHVSTGTFRR